MANDLTQAFVKQWDDTIRTNAQQKVSRLAAACLDRGTITGESFTANMLDALDDDSDDTERFGDTVLSNPKHTTRIAQMKDFYKALGVNRADEPKVLANPNGAYMDTLMGLWNRWQDKKIYRALVDDSRDKDDNLIALPSTQIITASAAAFTKAKLISARAIFRRNECDAHNGEELYIIFTASMLEDILADDTLTTADRLAAKMLQDGDVSGKWCGFNWIPYEAVDVSAGTASTVAWAKSGIHKGIGFSEGKASRRADKKDMMQVSMAGSIGAARVEEAKVVRIDYLV